MAKKKLTTQQVLDALEQTHGLKTNAADLLGVAFTTIERYIQASPKAQDMIKAMRHKRTDMAKLKLDEAIMKGESWAVMFTLKNKVDPDAEFVGESNRVDVTTNGKDLPGVIGVKLIDYRTGITETESGSGADHSAPSQDENPGDGSQVG